MWCQNGYETTSKSTPKLMSAFGLSDLTSQTKFVLLVCKSRAISEFINWLGLAEFSKC